MPQLKTKGHMHAKVIKMVTVFHQFSLVFKNTPV